VSDIVALPPDALAALRTLATKLCVIGDVWWLPSTHVQWFPGGKDRFVLVAGLEHPTGGGPPLVHLVAGSTRPSTAATTLLVPAGTAGLNRDTYFKHFVSGSLRVEVLHRDGRFVGRLPSALQAGIEPAVKASNLVALKKVWA
jgi:hypothetical protein